MFKNLANCLCRISSWFETLKCVLFNEICDKQVGHVSIKSFVFDDKESDNKMSQIVESFVEFRSLKN